MVFPWYVPYTDDFGCVWKTTMDGIVGTVVEHPLADWANWESYRGPDPSRVMGIGPIDWEAEAQAVRRARERDGFCQGGLRHGHTFLQLCDIHGYQNLLYQKNDRRLPGCPDLVFPRYKTVVFVNGCFWHHHDCGRFVWPTSNEEYWHKKITRNVERDEQNIKKLKSQGWNVITIWECQLKRAVAEDNLKKL